MHLHFCSSYLAYLLICGNNVTGLHNESRMISGTGKSIHLTVKCEDYRSVTILGSGYSAVSRKYAGASKEKLRPGFRKVL